ncbi:MAG TPA: response regulator transcription factor [Bryobacteraceae bacterium]|nr:response regulator transcription factor [Bryobacteraceae bacterium]
METQSVPKTEGFRPKLLLGDDHQLILDALGAMMRAEYNVLAVDSSQAFITAVETFQPDVAILDVSMPGADGFVTARKVLELQPGLPIVFLSMHSDTSYVDQATQVGAKAYLSKRLPAHELLAAVRTVLEGGTLLSAQQRDTGSAGNGKSDLTSRQREVLRLIALGSSAKDIANQLNISVRTAEFHRAAIMQRLGLHSTAQMTRYALANNIA